MGRFISVALFFCLSGPALADQVRQIVNLDDVAAESRSASIKLPIKGLPSTMPGIVSAVGIDPTDPQRQVMFVPEKVLIDSWATDANFNKNYIEGKSKKPTVQSLVANGFDPVTFDWSEPSNESLVKSRIQPADNFRFAYGKSQIAYVNAKGIIDLTKSGGILFDDPRLYTGNAKETVFPLQDKTKNAIVATNLAAFEQLGVQLGEKHTDLSQVAEDIQTGSVTHPLVNDQDRSITLGQVEFGKIVPIGVASIPPQLAQTYDVYVLQFAVTYDFDPPSAMAQLSFNVQCDPKCFVWEMKPDRTTETVDYKIKANTPKVNIRGIEVDQFLEIQTDKTSLVPQIFTYGLQESNFSWSMLDKAVFPGSHVFGAAIVVPKGTRQISIGRYAAVKTYHWLGLVEGDWATSGKFSETIQLK